MNPTPPSKAASRPKFEIGDLLRRFGGLFLASPGVCSTVRSVLYNLMACRTSELGGHLDVCTHCGHERPSYNTCGDRHCPNCQSGAGARWVAKRMATFLPISYFHCVFTLPSALRPLVLGNRKLLFDLLFQAVSATLLELAASPNRLGAQPGFTLVLHTWARDLGFHPHIHVVITGGGLALCGEFWKFSRGKYLFPVRVMSALFRGKFLAGLNDLFAAGKLKLSGRLAHLAAPEAFLALRKKLYRQNWVVYAKPPFATPEYVYRYLSRYTHRVGLTNRRILDVKDGFVRLKTRGEKSVVLKLDEFFRRFTLHILPEGFVRIRHYGLFSSANLKTKLRKARALLPASTGEGLEPKPSEPDKDKALRPCPRCGSPMQRWMGRIGKQPGSLYTMAFRRKPWDLLPKRAGSGFEPGEANDPAPL